MSEAGQSSRSGPAASPSLPPDVARVWREARPSQRLGIAAFLLICVGLLALIASLARRPHFSVLYANLQQEDAAGVVERLRELKVPYRITGAGTVEAPADRVDELRLELAAEALPAGGQTGFELLDRTRIGLSDFGEQLNYQRALQGELARTIAHLEGVEEARVHISLPRERLYTSEQGKPAASIVLKLRGGSQLRPAQVGSIVHLVSGAVGGLDPDSVAVVDTRGRLLSSPDGGPEGHDLAAASSQAQLRREYEQQIEQAVQSMLDGVVGPGNAMVRASATLSFERVETERETYEPATTGEVLASRRETKETYRGTGHPGAVGIPGVSSNTAARPAAARIEPGADQYERSELSAEYRVSRQLEKTLRPPGRLERLSLAVFLDETADVGSTSELEAAVAAAAGLQPDRGDEVVVSQVPFEAAASEDKGTRAFALRDFYFTVGRDFVAIVLMVVFLRFAVGLVRSRRAGARPPETAPTIRSTTAKAEPVPPVPERAMPESEFDADRAAAVLRQWLSSEETAEASPAPSGSRAER